MRKLLVTLIALGFSSVAMAGIGTADGKAAHNFGDGVCWDHTLDVETTCNETTWNTSGELCKVCHVPHEKVAGRFATAQLWNKAPSAADYQMYNEGDPDGPFGTIDGPEATDVGSTTKLCLSCHDGTVGLDVFGGHTGPTTLIDDGTNGYDALTDKGFNLTTSHPVSMQYYDGTALEDPDLQPLNNDLAAYLGAGATTADLLKTNGTVYTVECSSCHNVHDDRSTGLQYLLPFSNDGSALCLACHDK